MNYLFLDIDGVMNSVEDRFSLLLETDKHFEYLKEIVSSTNAQIILSSAWRINFHRGVSSRLITRLKQFNLAISDLTPIRKDHHRGKEIQQWLTDHDYSDKDSYVVLDDEDFDMQDIKEHVVKINMNKGLQQEHVQKCIDILKGRL